MPESRTSAFSLIEVLCAMVILSVALVGLIEGLTVAHQSTKESELQTTAALLAAGQIEMVRAEGGLEDGETEGDCGEGLPLYRWKQTIAPAGIDGLHQVTVTVERTNSSKVIYELQTLLFEAPDDPTLNTSDKQKQPATSSERRSR
jgi:prepilin-type N-terminal cleavage/methylation domain-containing protein